MNHLFVIPMAGESRRFREAGYEVPKYMLPLDSETVLTWSLRSFSYYFDSSSFLIIYRDSPGVAEFVRRECERLRMRDVRFAALDRPTSGQAETVMRGLDQISVPCSRRITIFNIDTARPNYRLPDNKDFDISDSRHGGFLEVFEGAGNNWSFVRPEPGKPGITAETSEKRPLSNLCCTGIYGFASAGLFRFAYDNPPAALGEAERKERYVAPLYNTLIRNGHVIRYTTVRRDQVIFCGVPVEYEALIKANGALPSGI